MSIVSLSYALGGAALGYGWFRVVGCSTGSCPLTSHAWSATLYGLVLGLLWGSR